MEDSPAPHTRITLDVINDLDAHVVKENSLIVEERLRENGGAVISFVDPSKVSVLN